ncbi:MAG: hypothetical protein MRZ61_03905 [Oscillospiraceae bacterium]|nr:hypothetical protein [Oscillospiraceae bacterium]
MDTITAKILVFLLSVFVLIIVAHQVTLLFDDSYETETATLYSSAEKVSFKGIYVRNETVVKSSTNGVLSYPELDGNKIAKDSVVAYVYKSAEDIYINQRIEALNQEVELLEKEQNPGTTAVVRPEFISALIEEKYQTITSLIARNNLSQLAEERKNFQSLLGIYQIIIGEETDYSDRIDRLSKEIEELEKKKSQPIDVITVPDSGYFISYADGYENVLSPDKLSGITVDKVKEIIENDGYDSTKVSKNAVGKIVNGYEWKLIGLINENDAFFRMGQDVTVKLSSTPDTVNAVIEDIIESEDSKESIIVLSCEKLNYNLVQCRTERVELILNDYSGIKVPREAIRFNKNNEKGVYILQGQKIAFKKLDVIYECDDYLLSKVNSDTGYISVYDDIITSGEIPAEIIEQASETTAAEEETTAPQETGSSLKTDSASETSGDGENV